MKKPDPRLAYDVIVTIGVLSMSTGAWLAWGPPAGLATFGGLVIGLSVYTVERLIR